MTFHPDPVWQPDEGEWQPQQIADFGEPSNELLDYLGTLEFHYGALWRRHRALKRQVTALADRIHLSLGAPT